MRPGPSQTEPAVPPHRGTILVVEDEVIVAADLADKLGHLGYDVIGSTPRGEEAVSIASRFRPDIILMDIRLQGRMDGVEAAACIHNDCHLPVIYLTAHRDPVTLERAKVTEPFGYLTKPFDESELETAIVIARAKHQAEQRLRESEERFRALTEATFDAIVMHEHGRALEVNQSFLTLLGYPRDEVIGRHVLDLVVAADSFATVAERLITGSEEPYEAALIRKDGHRLVVEIRARNVTFLGRRVRVASLRDISDRKAAEQALHENRERLALALEAARLGTFDWNVHTGETIWSEYHYRLLAYQPGEVNPSVAAWQQRVHPDDWHAVAAQLNQTLDEGEEYHAEYRVCWPDGQVRWHLARGRFLLSADGRADRLLGIVMDISEHQQAPLPATGSTP